MLQRFSNFFDNAALAIPVGQSQGHRGRVDRRAMAHPRIKIVGFFGNFKFHRKITDFGLALSTFDQFRFFASPSFLPTTSALFIAIS